MKWTVEQAEKERPGELKEMARRMFAAYISVDLGVSLQTALKSYTKPDVGPFWYGVAAYARGGAEFALEKLQRKLHEPPRIPE